MEALSSLKHRSADAGSAGSLSPCSSDGEDGPYFDLELTLPEDEADETNLKSHESEDIKASKMENGDEKEEEAANENAESSSILLNVSEETTYTTFPVSLLKSATKFRVLMLKFKRSKSEKTETSETNGLENVKIQENQGTNMIGKFFTVRFNVEEVKAPIISLFNREGNNSPKEKQGKGSKSNVENLDPSGVSDDKKLVQKYLKMVKPLYVLVSKRYVEKLKFSGQFSVSGTKGEVVDTPAPAPAMEGVNSCSTHQRKTEQTDPSVARVVSKQLAKSRSASATVAAVPPRKTATVDRRDDSLLQVQDGIQDAILHCKRSFQRP